MSKSKGLITDIKAKYKAVLGDLEQLELACDMYFDDESIIKRCINTALSSAEAAFLSSKNLMLIYPKESGDVIFQSKEPWKCEKEDPGLYLLLPPLVSKHNKNKSGCDGKAIRNLVWELLKDKQDQPFGYSEITFVFHIALNDAVPDFDNVEIKSLLDSLQGIALKNDTMLDYELHAYGCIDKKSYTELWIFPKEKGC